MGAPHNTGKLTLEVDRFMGGRSHASASISPTNPAALAKFIPASTIDWKPRRPTTLRDFTGAVKQVLAARSLRAKTAHRPRWSDSNNSVESEIR